MASMRVTPETLSEQGNALVGFAGDLKDVLASIETKIGDIIDGWDGLAQDAYFEMYQELKKSLDQFPGIVESLGSATVSAADTYARVDEELSTSFKSAMSS